MGEVVDGKFGGDNVIHERGPAGSLLPPQGDFANEHDRVDHTQHWGSVYDVPFPDRQKLVQGLLGRKSLEAPPNDEKEAERQRHPAAGSLPQRHQ